MRIGSWICAVLAVLLMFAGCERKSGNQAESDLGWAARQGDVMKVQSLIARGASVHATDSSGRTPLHNAAVGGHLAVAQLLVRCGARIDAIDNRGSTPAMLALAGNHRPVVEYLVGEGAAVDLFLATYLGDAAKVQEYIAAGADVNAKGPAGLPPLYCAILGNQLEAARRLIDSGADVEGGDRDWAPPLCLAVRRGQSEMVKLLLAKGANPDSSCEDNWFCEGLPLGIAIAKSDLGTAEILVTGGANANAKDPAGWTPLHVACMDLCWSDERWASVAPMIELLATHGADVNAADEEGLTPLHCAAYFGHKDAVAALLAKGADVNTKTKSAPDSERAGIAWETIDLGFRMGPGATPLHEVAGGVDPSEGEPSGGRSAEPNVVELLVAAGADVNAKDVSGKTPLYYAAERGRADVAESLIARGADVNAANGDGAPPLAIAVWNGHVRTAKGLIAAGARRVSLRELPMLHGVRAPRYESPLLTALQGSYITRAWSDRASDANEADYRREWVRLLLENGADPNERDEHGDTPLHIAARLGAEESIRQLITHGTDIEARNLVGATPLHQAACGTRKEAVLLLLDSGANVNAQDNDGDTPLHSAALRGHKEVVELLVAHGADSTIRNSRDRTPRDEALRRGHGDIVQLLMAKEGHR